MFGRRKRKTLNILKKKNRRVGFKILDIDNTSKGYVTRLKTEKDKKEKYWK